MHLAKISSKGQVTIPKVVREALGVNQGDSILFMFDEGKVAINKVDLAILIPQERGM
ncbi:AbrB/MazE/SpoVT family DNA-binding domain-containing protein [Bacillus songklensis]|uniref:AbrB/MazE/SpoVT family DNA-binding domain-containing protein n=1 Tax=Bacillus songklensis TaxID=1069116 RepID=A0ABV8B729_9BACI